MSKPSCRYCGKAIEGKGKKICPGLVFCSKTCFIRDAYKQYPGTSLAEMLRRMYPDMG